MDQLTRKEIDDMVDAMVFDIDLGEKGNAERKKYLKLELSPNDEILEPLINPDFIFMTKEKK